MRFEYRPQFSPRGRRWGITYRVHINGELLYSTQADIHAAVGALIEAYAYDGRSWYLYLDDGTPTHHSLIHGDADDLSGVRVIHREWPTGDGAEYATGRVYAIVLEKTKRANESSIIEFEESVRYIGTGGPEYKMVKLPNGMSVQQLVSQYTPIQIIQRGTMVGLNTWPTVPAYAPPLWPAYEDQQQRIVDYISPQYLGRQYVNYRVNWTYVFNMPSLVGGIVQPPHVPIYY